MITPPKPNYKDGEKVVYHCPDKQDYEGTVLKSILSSPDGTYDFYIHLERSLEGTETSNIIVRNELRLSPLKVKR